jgi:hypothetical protein
MAARNRCSMDHEIGQPKARLMTVNLTTPELFGEVQVRQCNIGRYLRVGNTRLGQGASQVRANDWDPAPADRITTSGHEHRSNSPDT